MPLFEILNDLFDIIVIQPVPAAMIISKLSIARLSQANQDIGAGVIIKVVFSFDNILQHVIQFILCIF